MSLYEVNSTLIQKSEKDKENILIWISDFMQNSHKNNKKNHQFIKMIIHHGLAGFSHEIPIMLNT